MVWSGECNNLQDRREDDADARYLMPAQINFVDRLEVSEEKSPRSMQATLSIGVCDDEEEDDDDEEEDEVVEVVMEGAVVVEVEFVVRVTASKAIPAPVAPPPMTKISQQGCGSDGSGEVVDDDDDEEEEEEVDADPTSLKDDDAVIAALIPEP